MMRNFGPEDFARRLLPKPVTAVFAAVTLLLSLASSPPAFAQGDPFAWFEQFFRPQQPSHVAKPRPEFHRSAPREHLSRPRSSYPAAERAARRPTERAGEKAIAKEPESPTSHQAFSSRSLATASARCWRKD